MAEKNLCGECNGKCCRHISLEIDAPDDHTTRDNVRWFLTHKGVQVYVEDSKWYLQVPARCRHLDENNRCAIYDTRPKICRKYSTENCEKSNLEFEYELHFRNDTQFMEHLAAGKRNGRAKAAKKK